MYDPIHSHDTINTTSPLHLKHMNKRGSKAATFQPRTICIKNDRLDLFDHGSIMDKNKKDQLFLHGLKVINQEGHPPVQFRACVPKAMVQMNRSLAPDAQSDSTGSKVKGQTIL